MSDSYLTNEDYLDIDYDIQNIIDNVESALWDSTPDDMPEFLSGLLVKLEKLQDKIEAI